MSDEEFRAFLDLLMASDPWPMGEGTEAEQAYVVLVDLADRESRNRGYGNWIEAFHQVAA